MRKFLILCFRSDGSSFIHDHKPDTAVAALGVGHELTRDRVCESFRVLGEAMTEGERSDVLEMLHNTSEAGLLEMKELVEWAIQSRLEQHYLGSFRVPAVDVDALPLSLQHLLPMK